MRTIQKRLSISLGILACSAAFITMPAFARAGAPADVSALLYSTMPSTYAHRPDLAMDGNRSTWFRTAKGMAPSDFFLVELSQPVPVTSLDVQTGDDEGVGRIVDGVVEGSSDGTVFRPLATFDGHGRASANPRRASVEILRIKTKASLSELDIREINITSPAQVTRVQYGPGRGFVDTSQARDVGPWADKAEREMEEFWPDIAARLYSDKFITPNAVTVVYRTEKDGVAATGDGVMDVNANWCRRHSEDQGLTIHELTHVIQTYENSNAPNWFIEGTADYIRWVRFEPQNFHPKINPAKATYKDSYRTSAAFLGWCETHYDTRLMTKLNDAGRFGLFDENLFVKYCGKDVHTLWSEFLADYERDPANLFNLPTAPADTARDLPAVSGAAVPVDLSADYTTIGITSDGLKFAASAGIDAGGMAYSGSLLGENITSGGVRFELGQPDQPDVIRCDGQAVTLTKGAFSSIWLLGCSTNGTSRHQILTVHYADGSVDVLGQNFSDWFHPGRYPGESVALQTAYRNEAAGSKDQRPFFVYRYGFPLNSEKIVESVTLPADSRVAVLAVSLVR